MHKFRRFGILFSKYGHLNELLESEKVLSTLSPGNANFCARVNCNNQYIVHCYFISPSIADHQASSSILKAVNLNELDLKSTLSPYVLLRSSCSIF